MTPAPALARMAGAPGRRRPSRWLRTGLPAIVAAVLCGLLLARGITVVPDGEVAGTDLAGNPAFDARRFVDVIWASRVLPRFRDQATDIATVLQAVGQDADAAGKRYGYRPKSGDGPWTFAVRGTGAIKAADLQSRHATLTVGAGGQDVTLQIGPVIFGTALRDSLPFVSFQQVENQIQFAQVSRELNDRATAAARAGLETAKLIPGARIAFAGAMAASQPPQVTVVQLRLLGSGQ